MCLIEKSRPKGKIIIKLNIKQKYNINDKNNKKKIFKSFKLNYVLMQYLFQSIEDWLKLDEFYTWQNHYQLFANTFLLHSYKILRIENTSQN